MCATRSLAALSPFSPHAQRVDHPLNFCGDSDPPTCSTSRPAMNQPATRPAHATAAPPPNTLVPEHGWHCGHYFYRFRRDVPLSSQATADFIASLEPTGRAERFQPYIITGHKADFAFMAMDPDPLKVNGIHKRSCQAAWARRSNRRGHSSRSAR